MDKRNNGKKDEYARRERNAGIIRTVCLILAIACALAAVGCVIAYVATKKDILFIPMAIAAVGAILAFTYWSNVKA